MYFQCAIQMYFKGGMDKQSVIHLYNRILLDNKKIWTIDIYKNLDDSQVHYEERKIKADLKSLYT